MTKDKCKIYLFKFITITKYICIFKKNKKYKLTEQKKYFTRNFPTICEDLRCNLYGPKLVFLFKLTMQFLNKIAYIRRT